MSTLDGMFLVSISSLGQYRRQARPGNLDVERPADWPFGMEIRAGVRNL